MEPETSVGMATNGNDSKTYVLTNDLVLVLTPLTILSLKQVRVFMITSGTQQTLNRHQIDASSWFRFDGKPSNSGIPGGVELVSLRVRGKPPTRDVRAFHECEAKPTGCNKI